MHLNLLDVLFQDEGSYETLMLREGIHKGELVIGV